MRAKEECLREADRDPEMTQTALERDEDYYSEFKQCVGTKSQNFINSRERSLYKIEDENVEKFVEQGLDMVKLGELRDHDWYQFVAFSDSLKEKYA